jgi:UDPglucose--hexose-1-phosphate uridylyltransferase
MSELRKDPLSGDWIILSPNRAKRPQMLEQKKKPRKPAPKRGCPFEDLKQSHNVPIAAYPSIKKWRVAVIPNKYPALIHEHNRAVPLRHGLYEAKTGGGDHELVITRDHSRFFADLKIDEAAKVLEFFQERYRAVAREGCSAYALAFLNYGPSVGASIWHPHYQFLAIPFIPPHVEHSLEGARAYFKKNRRCARCDIIKAEMREKKRIIGENAHAIAFAPYVSKRPFEVSILPKKHFSQFEKTPAVVIRGIAEVAQSVLRSMKRNANDPDLNFYIHGAPLDSARGKPIDGRKYGYHHWHMEILPYLSYLGGFEFSTGIYINTEDPDEAARILRGRMSR